MTLRPQTYFEHLRSYVNDEYITHDGSEGKVVLTEKYFRPQDTRPSKRKITLMLPGPGLAFKLDNDDVDTGKGKSKPALFHFLDDQAKPWSRRCDFVVFYVKGRLFHADCIEFKSKSLAKDKIIPQLNAGVCWVMSLKRTIENYTGDKRRIRVRKFVFATNENPEAYLDANRQLRADPSVRFYHFDEVDGQPIADLANVSDQDI